MPLLSITAKVPPPISPNTIPWSAKFSQSARYPSDFSLAIGCTPAPGFMTLIQFLTLALVGTDGAVVNWFALQIGDRDTETAIFQEHDLASPSVIRNFNPNGLILRPSERLIIAGRFSAATVCKVGVHAWGSTVGI